MDNQKIASELVDMAERIAKQLSSVDYKEDFISGLKRLKFRNLKFFEDGYGQAILSLRSAEIRVQLTNDEKIEVVSSSFDGEDKETFRLNQYKKALRWISEREG